MITSCYCNTEPFGQKPRDLSSKAKLISPVALQLTTQTMHIKLCSPGTWAFVLAAPGIVICLCTCVDHVSAPNLSTHNNPSFHACKSREGKRNRPSQAQQTTQALLSLPHNREIETDSHFLLYCGKYKEPRGVFLSMWGEKSACFIS